MSETTVAQLIEKLQALPSDYTVTVSNHLLVAIWISDAERHVDLDWGNQWYRTGEFADPTYELAFDSSPDERVRVSPCF